MDNKGRTIEVHPLMACVPVAPAVTRALPALLAFISVEVFTSLGMVEIVELVEVHSLRMVENSVRIHQDVPQIPTQPTD